MSEGACSTEIKTKKNVEKDVFGASRLSSLSSRTKNYGPFPEVLAINVKARFHGPKYVDTSAAQSDVKRFQSFATIL